MQVPEINVVSLELLQRAVDGFLHVLRVATDNPAVRKRTFKDCSGLCGKEDLVPLPGPIEPESAG